MHFASHNTSSVYTPDEDMESLTDDSSVAKHSSSKSEDILKNTIVLPGNIIVPPSTRSKSAFASWMMLSPLLLIAFLLTMFIRSSLWNQSQSTITKASLGPAVLMATHAKKAIMVGESADIHIPLNPNGSAVTGMRLHMTYNSDILTLERITPGLLFTDIHPDTTPLTIHDTSTPGNVRYFIKYSAV